ncbi:MAG: dTDP-4-dehydrorhamnose reductase [Candidatus Xenobium sp.]|jgi:dTDP-4-dehydrorhamnose reductase|nr:dTDP-4-dehydrorhamnose reductase [Burkholderiales bacterium]
MTIDTPGRLHLVAGAAGMLGRALQDLLPGALARTHQEWDIAHLGTTRRLLEDFARAGGCILWNAAAWTAVEAAEDHPDQAARANIEGPRLLAEECARLGLGLVHVSTDFVFDGTRDVPYTEQDPPHPLGVYARTKLGGEKAVLDALPSALVARTSWVFGAGWRHFPGRILEMARRDGRVRAVEDEFGSPTYAPHLAQGLLGLVQRNAQGLFHLAGQGRASRLELARATLTLAGLGSIPVEPCLASSFPSRVRRPANSALDCARAASLGVALPPWREGVAAWLRSEGIPELEETP